MLVINERLLQLVAGMISGPGSRGVMDYAACDVARLHTMSVPSAIRLTMQQDSHLHLKKRGEGVERPRSPAALSRLF